MLKGENENIIEVKDVTVKYDSLTVLDNVSFNIKRGEIFVIVGGSGCGKSTMLRQMIGLEKPTAGNVFIDKMNITTAKPREKKKIMQKFGVLFQANGLFNSMTLSENIQILLDTYTDLSKKHKDAIINMKLEAVGLKGFGNYYPSEISGGMKKRVALARAMALDPEILFFDEPNSGLDPITAATMDKLVVQLNEGIGTTMVIVTHDLASILNISHNIIVLDRDTKGIIVEGNPEKLKAMSSNEKVYNFFNRLPEN